MRRRKGARDVALPLSFFREICKVTMRRTEREFVWGRAYMMLEWHLMSRNSDTAELLYSHLGSTDDCLQFYVIRPQNDDGDDGRDWDPKHVYANPLIPELCPVLALGNDHAFHCGEWMIAAVQGYTGWCTIRIISQPVGNFSQV